MNNTLLIVLLMLIAVFGYGVTTMIIKAGSKARKNRLNVFLSADVLSNNTHLKGIKGYLERKNLIRFISRKMIIEESEKYDSKISVTEFISRFTFGTVIGFVFIYFYFHSFVYLMPLGVIGGFVAVNMKLHKIKKNYIELTDSKLGIYMSSMATAISTFENLKGALQSVIPSLEQPIRADVEEAMQILGEGKGVRNAFQKMNEKYDSNELKQFHHQLEIIVKTGNFDNETLRNLAFKMMDKATYRRDLKSAHRSVSKTWYLFASLSLLMPVPFMVVSFENFMAVFDSKILSLVYLVVLITAALSYWKLEKLEIYDPSKDNSATNA